MSNPLRTQRRAETDKQARRTSSAETASDSGAFCVAASTASNSHLRSAFASALTSSDRSGYHTLSTKRATSLLAWAILGQTADEIAAIDENRIGTRHNH